MPMQAEQQESEADTRLDGPERPAETGKSALKALLQGALIPVSYTHLDVYKRQG